MPCLREEVVCLRSEVWKICNEKEQIRNYEFLLLREKGNSVNRKYGSLI